MQSVTMSIVNVVASVTLKQRFDLDEIIKKMPHQIEYNPAQFPGAIFRMKSPKTATLLFSTGKMVCTGSKSTKMAHNAVRKVISELRNAGIKVKGNAKVTIQNIVASVDLGGKVHIEEAARMMPRSMYEPEQFPGLIHRMIEPKSVILVFSSGKIICTGTTNEKDLHRAVNYVHSMLEEKNLMNYQDVI